MRRSLTSLVAALAALAAVVPASAVAQDAAPLTPVDEEDGFGGEQAVFARFSELDDDETRAVHEALSQDPNTAGFLQAMTAVLAHDGANADEIEGTLLPLVEGADPDTADRTLAAVMLDYYQAKLQQPLLQGTLALPEAFAKLDDRAGVLVAAVYGSQPTGAQRVRSNQLRRRI